jgi:hypothetical protein
VDGKLVSQPGPVDRRIGADVTLEHDAAEERNDGDDAAVADEAA